MYQVEHQNDTLSSVREFFEERKKFQTKKTLQIATHVILIF